MKIARKRDRQTKKIDKKSVKGRQRKTEGEWWTLIIYSSVHPALWVNIGVRVGWGSKPTHIPHCWWTWGWG